MNVPGEPAATSRTRWLGLGLLFLVSTFNYLDRFAFGALLPAMKQDLKLSDVQLSFVTGGALSIVYVLASIPVGRLADRFSRRVVIAGSVFTWSLMTALCSGARTFAELGAARVAIGIGEAGATAPANALIADLFGARRRAFALSVYALGLPLGTLIGFAAGPLIAEQAGWRMALLWFGAAGVIYALILAALLPDPRRAYGGRGRQAARVLEPFAASLAGLLRRRSYLLLCLGSALFTVVWLGLLGWLPTLFVRRFGMGMADAGWRLALTISAGEVCGLLLGGIAGDWLSRRDPRAYMWLCAGASLGSAPFLVLALLASTPALALAALFPAFVLGLVQGAPALAAVQALSSPADRALSVSAYFALVNILAGAGSVAIGALSDALRPVQGDLALGAALLVAVLLCNPLSALSFLASARRLRDEPFSGDRLSAGGDPVSGASR